MFKPWVKWCINNNLKFLVYLVWLIVLPFFLLAYIENAADDAMHELNSIKNAKKGNL
jgi:hypothetical protein